MSEWVRRYKCAAAERAAQDSSASSSFHVLFVCVEREWGGGRERERECSRKGR